MSEEDSQSVEYASAREAIDTLFGSDESGDKPASVPVEERSSTNENWLSTGIESLDKYLNGGIPPGRLVSFAAPAHTQGELFIKQIVSQHDSLYLTSLRPEWEVEETVRDHIQQIGSVEVQQIDTRVRKLDSDTRLEDACEYIDSMKNGSIIVIDSVDELETEPESAYVEFLHQLKQQLWEAGSAGILCCFEGDSSLSGRDITFRMSDIIWQLRRSVDANGVEYLLIVAKFRGGRAMTEPVKLKLTDEVRIDTSRDIA